MYGFLMICSSYMNFRKSRILNITGDLCQKVKISMTIREVPKVRILNISKDVEQKLMFSMVCGRGAGQDANKESSSPPDPQSKKDMET